MLFGLSLGLVVAAAVYVSDRRGDVQTLTPTPVQTAQQQRREEPPPEISALPHPATRFDFYDILPNEVVIPEVESQAEPVRTATSVDDPDSYVLQTGSFRIPEDAERMRAHLATLGIESRVQQVTIDNTDFHRVRVGPMNETPSAPRALVFLPHDRGPRPDSDHHERRRRDARNRLPRRPPATK